MGIYVILLSKEPVIINLFWHFCPLCPSSRL